MCGIALNEIAAYIIKEFSDAAVVHFIGLETRGNCAKNFETVYISHQESIQYILAAAKILMDAGINAAIYNYPLCVMERGYWGLCKQSISPEKIRYPEDCAMCSAKAYCGGFFHTTLSMAKPTVSPFLQEIVGAEK